jgi:FdhD protein
MWRLGNMDSIKNYRIIKYNQGIPQIIDDEIIIEKPLNIYINNIYYSTLMCTPAELVELAAGFMFSEGIISGYKEIDGTNIIDNNIFFNIKGVREVKKTNRAITSGCGRGSIHIKLLYEEAISTVKSVYSVSTNRIFKNIREFNTMSQLFAKTGCVHSSCLCGDEGILYLSEDIGRHNAMDKTIGKALINDVDLGTMMLFTTGRVSSDILIKAGRAGLPIVVSHSAPTDFAVDTAKKLNITLVGFVRGSRMNIYCGRERITYD